MKRFLTIFGILFAVLIIGIILLNDNKSNLEISNINKVEKAIDNKETFALVIGQSTCSACSTYYQTTLNEYYKTDFEIPIYVIYIDKSFSNDTQFYEFINKYNINITGTPTTYFVKNGEFTDTTGKSGNISLSELYDYIDTQNN